MSLELIAPDFLRSGGDAEQRRRQLIGRTGAMMFAGQGLLASVAMLAGHRTDPVGYWIAGVSLAISPLVWLGRHALSHVWRQSVTALGILMIGCLIHCTSDRYGMLYPAVVCLIALVFPIRWVLAQSTLMLVVYAAVLGLSGEPRIAESWLLLIGAMTVILGLVLMLQRRAVELVEREREGRALLDAFFDNAPLGLSLYDPQLRFVRVNRTTAEWAGRTPEEFVGRRLDDIHPGTERRIVPVVAEIVGTGAPVTGRELERDGRHLRGSHYPILGRDGEVALIASIVDDVTPQKAAEAALEGLLQKEHAARSELERARSKLTARNLELAALAATDTLTKLANRAAFDSELALAIAHADETGSFVGLVYVDLNGFKEVNDRLGHAAGDKLLSVVANRMLRQRRGADVVARIGGDEFVVLLTDLHPEFALEKLTTLAGRMHAVVSEPVAFGEATVAVTCSVGTSIYPIDAASGAELVATADRAMYLRKRAS